MRKLVSGIALAVVLVPGMALAQVKVIQEPDREVTQKVQHVDMTGSDLTGHREGPVGSYRVVPPTHKFPSLIQLRMDFNPELHASTDALR